MNRNRFPQQAQRQRLLLDRNGEFLPARLATVGPMKYAAMLRSINERPERLSQRIGPGRTAELIGHDAEFVSFAHQPQHGLDEVTAGLAVEPGGADNDGSAAGFFKYGQFAEWRGLGGSRFALTAGSALQAKVAKSGVPTINTSPRMNLRIEDCFEREDTCQGETITCLFTGGLILRKGLSYLIEDIAALRKKGLPIELRLAGEGEQRVELEDLVRELGLEDAIEFLGHVTNGSALWDQYRSADIFVLPTLAEGFPRVLYEAMSQSLPIVTTNVSGIPYLMRDRENALVIEPEDTLALIAAIEAVATQPELRKRLIAEGMGVVRPVLETDPGEQLMQLIQEHRD